MYNYACVARNMRVKIVWKTIKIEFIYYIWYNTQYPIQCS